MPTWEKRNDAKITPLYTHALPIPTGLSQRLRELHDEWAKYEFSSTGDYQKLVAELVNNAEKIIAALEAVEKDIAWCGSLENWWNQATDEQKKKAYASCIAADHAKSKIIRELENQKSNEAANDNPA